MSVACADLPDCECDGHNHHRCESKGTVVVKSRETGIRYHVCPDAWLNHVPESEYETVRKLA